MSGAADVVGAILLRSANVQEGQAYLQKDQRICAIVETPGNPEQIAQEE
jgi:hypothetical protein